MQVILGGPAAARLADWRKRSGSVQHSFLDVWSRPTQVASAIFGLGVGSLLVSRLLRGSTSMSVDGAALAGVFALALLSRFWTRGLDVHDAAKEISRRNADSAKRLRSALDGLPEAFRQEIRAEGRSLFRGADGIAVTQATALALIAAALATAPVVGITASLGFGSSLFAAGAALGVAAVVLPALVRLIVATTAEATRARTLLLEELAAIVEESLARPVAPVPVRA